ncbi:transcriptional regulator [Desulfocucumis palustris]|uniref:Transcriptional regulator n=1 Tax=Desulfocucumis palustris TaxID=1898651 RepID=A0A2L2XEG5_9FIRM|nr:FadR/GntR family transcriptional regulator [Desulfocucumis palustris]GBF34550.1 transcriptional regulator [Desulfocucumis palustris]
MINTYFRHLKKRSLYEDVASQILNLILEEKFKTGDRLPGEREMAETLGVNRGTLREALRVLEFMRVIEKRVGEGVFVSAGAGGFGVETVIFRFMSEDGLDAAALTGAHEAVTRIEGVMAELAAQRISEGELEEIGGLQRLLEEAVETGEHFTALDKEFHLLLGRAAKSPVLLSVATTMWVIMERYAMVLFGLRENRDKCIADHGKIIEALAAGKPADSRRITEEHFLWARRALFEEEENREL